MNNKNFKIKFGSIVSFVVRGVIMEFLQVDILIRLITE